MKISQEAKDFISQLLAAALVLFVFIGLIMINENLRRKHKIETAQIIIEAAKSGIELDENLNIIKGEDNE